jgi:TrmH family RNA methyltransferase
MFIAEGYHLVEAAIKSGWQLERVICEPEAVDQAIKQKIAKAMIRTVPSAQFGKIAQSDSPQGILAIAQVRDYDQSADEIIRKAKKLVACDSINDPGNLGTIIRTAVGFNYDAVILIGNCAEVYNPKTVRATQGALFGIPVLNFSGPEQFLKAVGGIFDLIALSNTAAKPLASTNKIKRPALILGGEIAGIDPQILAKADYRLRIEQSDRVESLNVSVAAGIAMYKFAID